MQIVIPQSYAMTIDHALMVLFPLALANHATLDDDVIQEIANMLREMLIRSKGLKKYYEHKSKLRMHIHNTCLTAIHRLKRTGRLNGEALCVVNRRSDDNMYNITILGTDKRTWKKRITDEKWKCQRTFIFKVPDIV